MAIIDDQRDTAAHVELGRDFPGDRLALGRILPDRTIGGEGEVLAVKRHAPLLVADPLADRQGIEKFIGDQQQRAIGRDRREALMPFGVRVPLPLKVAQHRTGFDEMHLGLEPGLGHHAQRIGGERPAPRPKLDVDGIVRPARAVPAIGQRRADHLAEHLADFGRGGEIAGGAQRIAGRVIMRVGLAHEDVDADRPGGANQLAQPLGETRRQATLSVPAIGSTRCRRRSAVIIK